MTAMNGTTMVAKVAMRFTPPIMMMARMPAKTTAAQVELMPQAVSAAAATALAWMAGKK